MAVTTALERFRTAWRERLDGPERLAFLSLLLTCAVFVLYWARIGTTPARAGAALLLFAVSVWITVRFLRARRDFRRASGIVARVLAPTDPELSVRTERALRLLEETEREASYGSSALAAHHLQKLLKRTSVKAVVRTAARRAKWFSALFVACAGATSLALILSPMRLAEGLNVLLSREGRAPAAMRFLDFLRVGVKPPSYLRAPERTLFAGSETDQPQGSVLTVRGEPRRDGRRLVLTNGAREVPFLSDGSDGVVAHWQLDDDAELFVAARFGDVLVYEPRGLSLKAVPDETPSVQLFGAPQSVELTELDRLELRYEASDDHGLRQVDLVMRSGGREERRVLARFDGESRLERGATRLEPRDPFLRQMFLPVLLRIEAKDNDPVSGPKWGESEAITLLPPSVGQLEADRYLALKEARSSVVSLLKAWMTPSQGLVAQDLAELKKERTALTVQAAQALREAAVKSYGGLILPSGLEAFLIGQARVLDKAPRPGVTHEKNAQDVLLAVDVAIRGLARRNAASVAKRLGDVAEEVADAAKLARETEKRKIGLERLEVALSALSAGATELTRLGDLGRDLGTLASAAHRGIERVRQRADLMHTELAARHLAARLRRPVPSFGSASRGGVESGHSPVEQPSADASQAVERFNQLASELEQLAQEHQKEISEVERALAEAEASMDLEALREEAERRAEELRDAVSPLPAIGAQPGSARATAALGKEHARGMAQDLERLDLEDAVQSGRDAQSAVREAKRRAALSKEPSDQVNDEDLARAERAVSEQLAWAEQALERFRRASEEKARARLSESGSREEELSRRAESVAERAAEGTAALPQEALESLERASGLMQQAARELSEGRGGRGLEHQREAQRLLERASRGKATDPDDQRSPRPDQAQDGTLGEMRTDGEVPDSDEGVEAERFRKRVLDGLGQGEDGTLAPAIKRYAEGLLR